jgi:hypothetical protein
VKYIFPHEMKLGEDSIIQNNVLGRIFGRERKEIGN